MRKDPQFEFWKFPDLVLEPGSGDANASWNLDFLRTELLGMKINYEKIHPLEVDVIKRFLEEIQISLKFRN